MDGPVISLICILLISMGSGHSPLKRIPHLGCTEVRREAGSAPGHRQAPAPVGVCRNRRRRRRDAATGGHWAKQDPQEHHRDSPDSEERAAADGPGPGTPGPPLAGLAGGRGFASEQGRQCQRPDYQRMTVMPHFAVKRPDLSAVTVT
jgi:hypothetical protein